MATDYNLLLRNNFVRILLMLLLLIIAFVIGFGLFTKKHIKIWVLEMNDTDTVYKPQNDTIIKTVYINAPQETKKSFSQSKPTIKQENKRGDNNAAGRDNNGIQGKDNDNNHIVNGTNNGINGNVVLGYLPATPDRALIDTIKKAIPNKSDIIILKQSTTNAANKNFSQDLYKMLIKEGYIGVELENFTNTHLNTIEEKFEIVTIRQGYNIIWINVG